MADSGFLARTKYPGFNKIKTLFFNVGQPVTATGWAQEPNGSLFLASNKTIKYATYPLGGLAEGDQLIAFRVVGGAGKTATLSAQLERSTKASGGYTTSLVAGMTAISQTADAAIDTETSCSEHVVATDYQYYVIIGGTTGDESDCDISINGIELDVKRA